MESSRPGRGNDPRARPFYSKDTKDMIQLMMQQSRLTNFQQRQISLCLKNGKALPLTCNPTSSSAAAPPQPKPQPIRRPAPSAPPQRRSAESCRSGDSYTRERFRPGPTRDLEKEKRRLQNILATGREEEPRPRRPRRNVPESLERDRFQEVLDEIEERRAFLADMTALGQEKRWVSLIDTEISQKVRELELIDKARTVDMKEAVITTSDEREHDERWREVNRTR